VNPSNTRQSLETTGTNFNNTVAIEKSSRQDASSPVRLCLRYCDDVLVSRCMEHRSERCRKRLCNISLVQIFDYEAGYVYSISNGVRWCSRCCVSRGLATIYIFNLNSEFSMQKHSLYCVVKSVSPVILSLYLGYVEIQDDFDLWASFQRSWPM